MGNQDEFMYLFQIGEFEPEYTETDKGRYFHLMKVGGGTIGKAYDGAWLIETGIIGRENESAKYQYSSQMVKTHEDVAFECFWDNDDIFGE